MKQSLQVNNPVGRRSSSIFSSRVKSTTGLRIRHFRQKKLGPSVGLDKGAGLFLVRFFNEFMLFLQYNEHEEKTKSQVCFQKTKNVLLITLTK